MKKFIISNGGTRCGGWILWHLESNVPIGEADARAHQQEYGYPIAGYGFEGFTMQADKGGTYHAHWKCASSCD